jgi:hypothetical protein
MPLDLVRPTPGFMGRWMPQRTGYGWNQIPRVFPIRQRNYAVDKAQFGRFAARELHNELGVKSP